MPFISPKCLKPLALLQVAQLKVFLVELVKRKENKRKERPNDKKNKTKENDFISVFPNNFPWDVWGLAFMYSIQVHWLASKHIKGWLARHFTLFPAINNSLTDSNHLLSHMLHYYERIVFLTWITEITTIQFSFGYRFHNVRHNCRKIIPYLYYPKTVFILSLFQKF